LAPPFRLRYEQILDQLAKSPDLSAAFQKGRASGIDSAAELALSLG
jgi:hypothetical protein